MSRYITVPYDYSLDRLGSVTMMTTTGQGSAGTYTYDAANQLFKEVTGSTTTSYSYDRDGNLTSFGTNTLSYDASEHWTGGTINLSSVSFSYDGLCRRASSGRPSTRR